MSHDRLGDLGSRQIGPKLRLGSPENPLDHLHVVFYVFSGVPFGGKELLPARRVTGALNMLHQRTQYSNTSDIKKSDTLKAPPQGGTHRFQPLRGHNVDGFAAHAKPNKPLNLPPNDAYSAIQIAVALSKAFGVGVNDLPLSLVLSWYEQKAVAILLTLLHLGIRNIRLGPSLPAFLEPEAVGVLVDKFAIKPTTTAEADLREILAGK